MQVSGGTRCESERESQTPLSSSPLCSGESGVGDCADRLTTVPRPPNIRAPICETAVSPPTRATIRDESQSGDQRHEQQRTPVPDSMSVSLPGKAIPPPAPDTPGESTFRTSRKTTPPNKRQKADPHRASRFKPASPHVALFLPDDSAFHTFRAQRESSGCDADCQS